MFLFQSPGGEHSFRVQPLSLAQCPKGLGEKQLNGEILLIHHHGLLTVVSLGAAINMEVSAVFRDETLPAHRPSPSDGAAFPAGGGGGVHPGAARGGAERRPGVAERVEQSGTPVSPHATGKVSHLVGPAVVRLLQGPLQGLSLELFK